VSDAAAAVVRQRLVAEWTAALTELERLGPVVARPTDSYKLIRIGPGTSDASIEILLGPLVLHVPERGGHKAQRLFIYLEGAFVFDRVEWTSAKALVTTRVSAEAAYFRLDGAGDLVLVHGAHYDHEPSRSGHPVFHAQLRGSLHQYGAFVRTEFSLTGQIHDGLSVMLRNVRAASAQLDIFSLLLQVAADQLLRETPSAEQRIAFNRLRGRALLCGPQCAPTAAVPSSRPTTEYRCYRARHWYPEA
jgi:hypothetical protein